MKTFFSILFFLPIFFTPKNSFANAQTIQGDTSIKYDINDPRNPNCPCHDAQRKADEEYQRLQQQNGNNQVDNNSNNPVDHNPVNSNPDFNSNNDNTSNNKNKSGETVDNSKSKNVSISSGTSTKHYFLRNSHWKKMNKGLRKLKKSLRKKSTGKKWRKGHLIDCGRF